MSSSDEPIFVETDTGWGTGNFVAPGAHYYVGAIAESEIPGEMPVIYFDWEVAKTLQFEGQRSIETDKEVAGILLGTSSADFETIKVSHIAIARDDDSSPVHFKFTFSVWDDLIDQMEKMSRDAGEELLLLGWYHTHPNMAVFLSRYDLLTHRDFHRPYQFALVLAPQLGTEDTSVGFFCNRGTGTPLLPGIRLFGAINRGEVKGRLPWRFQILEVEGVEEGEFAASAANSQSTPVVAEDANQLQQIGVVRREAPEWLLLGHDVNEGAILPILEQMASKVVHERADQLGVLLGTQSTDKHVTVTRVRFLGNLSASSEKEEAELLVSLGFMARTFPAHGEEKIVGLVRIVSPHQFEAGDSYDPLTHNIRLPELLAQLGYDLDKVPFQVGLVLYPGIEDETFLFQVFAQHKSSKPILLMSMQASAPASMAANERYEPIGEACLEIESAPCMKAPEVLWQGRQARRDEHIIQTGNRYPTVQGRQTLPGAASTGAINWDDVEDEDEDEEAPATRAAGLPLVVILMSILLFLVGVLLVIQLTNPFGESADFQEDAPMLLEGAEVVTGMPYEYTVIGCGADWNPSLACRPVVSGEGDEQRVDLIRVETLEFYTEQTIEVPEVWLLPEEGDARPRLRLDSRSEGENYTFSLSTGHKAWGQFWKDGAPFTVSLVIAPHGSELVALDELSYLRRSEELEMDGAGLPGGTWVAPVEGQAAPRVATTVPAAGAPAGLWSWHNIGARHQVTYHVGRQSFAGNLEVSGGEAAEGAWRLEYRAAERSSVLYSSTVDNLKLNRGKVDFAQALTGFMRASPVVASLETVSAADDPSAFVVVVPPPQRGAKPLSLVLALEGSAAASSVKHRVCVMMSVLGDADVAGQARVSTQGEMRTTFNPDAEGKMECADGGNSGRWTEATFGPEQTQLRFVYLGAAAEAEAAKGKEQHYPIPAQWNSTGPSCIAITVHLDTNGWQARPPAFNALYRLVDGRCQ
jgi:proteasome lid subunit RPN8/RPN11